MKTTFLEFEQPIAELETRIEELKGVLDSSDAGEIKAKSDSLMEAAHKLAESIYAKAQAEQSAPGAASANGDSEAEVVEEADYEVIDEEAKPS